MPESDRERTATGEYVETVTVDRVLDAVASHPDPTVTAREIGDALGCSTDAARKKLTRLHDRGQVERKTVGARAVVWWLTDAGTNRERDRDYLKSFGKYADTNIGETVEQVHEELGKGFEESERELSGQ